MGQGSVVCIGKFNGMHIGHQALIQYAAAEAKRRSFLSGVITFTCDGLCPPIPREIYTEQEKKKLTEESGIDWYKSYPFTEEFRQMSPERFIQKILHEECHAKIVVVGEDFRFGFGRRGDIRLLDTMSAQYSYECRHFERIAYDGQVVSSSRIRALLAEGKIEKVNKLLGRPFFLEGTVVMGNQIGRTLDMPTVNLIPAESKLLPPNGVYASRVTVDGAVYKGVTNIGIKPTIPGKQGYCAETYLFDFHENIYGKNICVELFRFLRPEKKFSGLEELKENMERDKKEAW